MQHYTPSKYTVMVDGTSFTYTNELGTRLAVSRDGRVYTNRHRVSPGSKRGRGYYGVTIDSHTIYIHHLVYEMFVERVPDGMEIDHINTDIHDNRVENLRAVTKSGNMRNPVTRERNLKQLGSVRHRASQARRREVCVSWTKDDGTIVYRHFGSVTDASKFTGACRSDIARVCAGKRKTAKGYTFYYGTVPLWARFGAFEFVFNTDKGGDVCDRYHK